MQRLEASSRSHALRVLRYPEARGHAPPITRSRGASRKLWTAIADPCLTPNKPWHGTARSRTAASLCGSIVEDSYICFQKGLEQHSAAGEAGKPSRLGRPGHAAATARVGIGGLDTFRFLWKVSHDLDYFFPFLREIFLRKQGKNLSKNIQNKYFFLENFDTLCLKTA